MICVHAPVQQNAKLPDLVLLHGWCMSASIWTPLLPRLQAFCNPWCVDLPNHGMSAAGPWPENPARIIDAILHQVPAAAVWLGWSLAGLLVLEAAAARSLRGLVLLAASPKFIQDKDWPGMPAADFISFRDNFANDPAATLIGFQKLQFGQRSLPRTAQEQLYAGLTLPHTERLLGLRQALDYLHVGDTRDQLANIDCPCLLVGGTGDRLIPPTALELTANRLPHANLPHANLKLLPDAGHALMLEQPDAVSDALREFLHAL